MLFLSLLLSEIMTKCAKTLRKQRYWVMGLHNIPEAYDKSTIYLNTNKIKPHKIS